MTTQAVASRDRENVAPEARERIFVGIDIGYREPVAAAIPLSSFNVSEIEPVQDHLAEYGIVSAQHGSLIRPGTVWMNFTSEEKISFVMEIMKVLPGTNGRTPAIVDGKVIS